MSEYKNGVNAFGNMSVDKADYANEVHTGRAVFVDEDKYANDAKYKAKVDQCLAEGFHKVGSSDSGGGGGSSDFSTAEVTLMSVSDNYEITVDDVHADCIKRGIYTVIAGTPVTVTVPLYKGKNLLPISVLGLVDESYLPTTEGSIVLDLDAGNFVVTGNGTVTAKGFAND